MMVAGIWVAAILTLMATSYLWKENPAYRYAEHIFIGVAAGHALVMGVQSVRNLALNVLVSPKDDGTTKLLAALSIVMGLLLYARFFKNGKPLTALPFGVLLGTGAGLSLGGTIVSQSVAQIRATIIPLSSIDNIILVVGVLATMCYFFYSAPKSNAISGAATVGRYMMMIAFGAAYGNTVMGRVALLTGRLQFLMRDWLHIMK
jgi:predicted membrane protein